MEIDDRTNTIKHYSMNIVCNFLKIGTELKTIRDKELFKDKYNNFTEYLESAEFTFSKGFVYKLFQVLDDPKLKVSAPTLGLTRTLELLAVPEREMRENLTDQAIKQDMTTR